MKMFFLVSFCLSVLLGFSQDTIYKPATIDDAANYFVKKWSNETKEKFLEKGPTLAHFSIGMWVRNNWIHGNRDSLLVNQFNTLGIYAADDMSGVILELVYKRLKKLPENMDSIIQPYKEFWSQQKQLADDTKAHIQENIQKFNIGDSVRLFIPIDSFTDGRQSELGDNRVYYFKTHAQNDYPNLILDGVVTGKNDGYSRYMDAAITIKITYASRHDIRMHKTFGYSPKVHEIPGKLIEVGNRESFIIQNIEIKKY